MQAKTKMQSGLVEEDAVKGHLENLKYPTKDEVEEMDVLALRKHRAAHMEELRTIWREVHSKLTWSPRNFQKFMRQKEYLNNVLGSNSVTFMMDLSMDTFANYGYFVPGRMIDAKKLYEIQQGITLIIASVLFKGCITTVVCADSIGEVIPKIFPAFVNWGNLGPSYMEDKDFLNQITIKFSASVDESGIPNIQNPAEEQYHVNFETSIFSIFDYEKKESERIKQLNKKGKNS